MSRQGSLRGETAARRSAAIWRFMVPWMERYLRRHLNALRIARWGEPPRHAGPIVVYANHPAWWDAVLFIVLAGRLFPERACFAPIDAAMLRKYAIFGRIGAFGVDLASPRGAAAFLRESGAILADPGHALWVTPQGRFVDPRQRPLGLRPGIAHLAELAPEAWFLPLAIEYCFWNERGAEALVGFGSPLTARKLLRHDRADRLTVLEAALTMALDQLALDAMARDPDRFRLLVAGRAGIGGVYDLGRRLRALASGRGFDPAHGGREP